MNSSTDSVFIIVSLFLLAIIALMLVAQLIMWLTFTNKKIKVPSDKSYQTLLAKEQYNGTIKKVKFVAKFNKYDKKNNVLKLKSRDFEEKTIWNFYQNLISISLVRWKKANQNTSIILITSTLTFYLSAIITIICALTYYINLWQGTINTINTTVLSILSFVVLLILVLSWLIWTMTYEKIRKEIIELASTFEDPTLIKAIKIISGYKTLFPSSELLF